MKLRGLSYLAGFPLAALLMAAPAHADQTEELLKLRNTVVGLLEALVSDGVVTEDRARAMVEEAEAQALAEIGAREAEAAPAPGSVRVPYVPQIVKDEIKNDLREDLREEVAADVLDQARADGWGVPGGLPAWITDIEWRADVRVRSASAFYDSGNAEGVYFDFQAINEAGGTGPAGTDALLNVSEDRDAMQTRARLGLDVHIDDRWLLGLRTVTGNEPSPVTRNATQGDYEVPYRTYFDLAYVHFKSEHVLVSAGRIPNPFLSTDLVWDDDLTFDGVAVTGVLPFNFRSGEHRAYLTIAGLPIDEVDISSADKYLLAAQLGAQMNFGQASVGLGAAYYDFVDIEGERNAFQSTLDDFTAPRFLQKGNTVFDIRNDLDSGTNLYALAADYDLVDVVLLVDSGRIFTTGANRPLHVRLAADYVSNVGFDEDEVLERTGVAVDEKSTGYQIELGVGMPEIAQLWDWRVTTTYRHLERDAVLDAFTDSDLHLGGTDSEGWALEFELGLSRKSWIEVSYLSASEIDGPPLGIDLLFLDLNAKF
jgi:hypothetical protein